MCEQSDHIGKYKGRVCLDIVVTALIVGHIPEEFFPKFVFMGCVSYEMQYRMGL